MLINSIFILYGILCDLTAKNQGLCNNKQLLDEVEHDIVNYQNRGLCVSAEAEG